ncbi:hypothetical protein IWW55_006613 [Coemansia sp. RSA 2706]|nr:hypothetical protein LPJ63_005057 [Coemansia sp. RSA 2711]KAJ2287937.1 hypothetical protein IWW55_006613 [Coemansia sp. RSA 2706]KAJ2308443.1 hypothetical protein IWW52_005888 [Coemansia sp. RSA 2704]KAJ2311886.1 hypothetical protein IWW54_002398 [Coemansia sp. RSA 2705]KAJ2314425.1 hypothetical protein IWW51_005982 [Coemansia sp. RSA 2702]KAJ2714314.1 hypothetical protein H4R23_005801 [Coemansia sp. Cherry 401B]
MRLVGLALFAAVVRAAATDSPRLKCRSAPNGNALVLRAYGDRDVVDIACQAQGAAVGGSTLWHRTQDGCYVTSRFVAIGGNATEPTCASLDSPRPCAAVATPALQLIERYEGFVARPRPDITGLPTIGYGHRCASLDCAEVPVAFPLSRGQAHELLRMDLRNVTACLAQAVTNASLALNANQWGALASWAFNVGCEMAGGSQLVARLNRGEDPGAVAAHELPRWRIFHGKRVPELVSRRADELYLFQTASDLVAYPQCNSAPEMT